MKKQKLAVCVLSAALMIGAATLTSYAAEGWQQSGNSWIYVDNNGNKVTNTWKKGADNLWRYLDSQGNIASNCWVDDEYFVESTGIMATDKWLKLPKRNPAWNETSATTVWYYFSTSGKMVSDGWSKIGGKYYYFDGDGAMQTGWVDDDTYYTNADGVMQIGWAYLEDPDDTKKDDDEVKPGDDDEDHHWYYFQSSGKKYVPSLGGAKYKQYKIDGTYYCFDENGAMQTGWSIWEIPLDLQITVIIRATVRYRLAGSPRLRRRMMITIWISAAMYSGIIFQATASRRWVRRFLTLRRATWSASTILPTYLMRRATRSMV